jgi:hypothetical protein
MRVIRGDSKVVICCDGCGETKEVTPNSNPMDAQDYLRMVSATLTSPHKCVPEIPVHLGLVD